MALLEFWITASSIADEDVKKIDASHLKVCFPRITDEDLKSIEIKSNCQDAIEHLEAMIITGSQQITDDIIKKEIKSF